MADPPVRVVLDAPDVVRCQACRDVVTGKALRLGYCGCSYCDDCLADMFRLAMKEEDSYPPRCHGGAITLKAAKKHLSDSMARHYHSRMLEMVTKNKTYCHNVTCNSFIAPHSIHNDVAHCQKCRRTTCQKCKEPGHFGPCTSGYPKALASLAKKYRWKNCPDCKRMVEKDGGCNHMTCRCGCEFCWGCGVHLERCNCYGSEDEEDRDDNEIVGGWVETNLGDVPEPEQPQQTTFADTTWMSQPPTPDDDTW